MLDFGVIYRERSFRHKNSWEFLGGNKDSSQLFRYVCKLVASVFSYSNRQSVLRNVSGTLICLRFTSPVYTGILFRDFSFFFRENGKRNISYFVLAYYINCIY